MWKHSMLAFTPRLPPWHRVLELVNPLHVELVTSNIEAMFLPQTVVRLNHKIPPLSHLIVKLNTTFDVASSKLIMDFIHELPSTCYAAELSESSLVNLYKDNIPSPGSLSAELDLWKHGLKLLN